MDWFDGLLKPIMVVVAWIMVQFHALFSQGKPAQSCQIELFDDAAIGGPVLKQPVNAATRLRQLFCIN